MSVDVIASFKYLAYPDTVGRCESVAPASEQEEEDDSLRYLLVLLQNPWFQKKNNKNASYHSDHEDLSCSVVCF